MNFFLIIEELNLLGFFLSSPATRHHPQYGVCFQEPVLGQHSYNQEMRRPARRAVEADVARGAALYVRARHLPRVLPLMAGQCDGPEPDTTRLIVRRLAQALRRERALGRAGHWTYDLNRHMALTQAWKAESGALRSTPHT